MAGLCTEARRQGREEAEAVFAQAKASLKAQTEQAVRELWQTAQALRQERCALLQEAAQGTVDLAFRVAQRVVRQEVGADPGVVVPLVRELLQRSAAASSLTIRLSPRDHAHLTAHLGAMPEAAGLEGLRLRVDTLISPGGCVVVSEEGSLDARIETQLERIETALRTMATRPSRRPQAAEAHGEDPETA
jgi:flagellar biosynthesis/type III secretory pathway protein FliH